MCGVVVGWGGGGGRVSDIAPTVITARSAYGSSCCALCFLPGKYGWNINCAANSAYRSFFVTLRRSSEPRSVCLLAMMTVSPKHALHYLKIKALSPESEYFIGPETTMSNKKISLLFTGVFNSFFLIRLLCVQTFFLSLHFDAICFSFYLWHYLCFCLTLSAHCLT